MALKSDSAGHAGCDGDRAAGQAGARAADETGNRATGQTGDRATGETGDRATGAAGAAGDRATGAAGHGAGGLLPPGAAEVPQRVQRDQRMTRVLRQNSGVISLGGLHRLGFSRHDVAGFVAHGDLRRLHRGVYVDGRAPLKDDAYFKAALLTLGTGAWLSGTTAAMVWGLTAASVVGVEISVVASSTPKHPGLRIRRVSQPPHPSEIRIVRGLCVSSISRLLIETAAGGGTREELDQLIEAAVRRNRLDVPDLAATLARHHGRRGAGRVNATVSAYLPRSDRKSGLERSFDRWLTKHPGIPEPQRNVKLGPWELDCYWPE
ncbi:MAG TPA: type IV toxin-antitoxin system AbiEi family antitoxin domain-containing protein, partial [Solirubrobacteraceae bacterium]|nr:type IV toxin-antitoxin system AbiEi family antitoxin domain-containing protein [Solirubrobacteraceae bacterium]